MDGNSIVMEPKELKRNEAIILYHIRNKTYGTSAPKDVDAVIILGEAEGTMIPYQVFENKNDALLSAEVAVRTMLRTLERKLPNENRLHLVRGENEVRLSYNGFCIASWEAFEATYRIHIESRHKNGERFAHEFQTTSELLSSWHSDDHIRNDSEILLLVQDGLVLYSSLANRCPSAEDGILRIGHVVSWFSGR